MKTPDTVLVLEIHIKVVGKNLLNSWNLLDSAVNRPFQTFDEKELYPDLFEKAAVLLESIVKNHPFIDGNKRTGYVSVIEFLEEHDFSLITNIDDIIDLLEGIAMSKYKISDTIKFFEHNCIKTLYG